MKYLHLTLRFPADAMHPIHRFIDESDAIERDVLVHGQTVSQQDTFLFYVEGDRQHTRQPSVRPTGSPSSKSPMSTRMRSTASSNRTPTRWTRRCSAPSTALV
ncbi:MAG: hypothetical protein J07HN4v3_00683 [Halonotius sp. J07HN4]|nr:MAG: hypothetical protein J07HN4v3_00683 [Halonotius sp. J07HN4]